MTYSNNEDEIILVDIYDNEIDTGKKLETHEKKLLHRAFSIFIIDGNNMLIQKRADTKYHSGGLYANSCCSHPRAGESLEIATKRRLLEETGLNCEIKEYFDFIYKADFENGLSEYEYDHVFIGIYDKEINNKVVCNKDEASWMDFVDIDWLAKDLIENPHKYSAWFIIAAPKVIKIIKNGELK